MGEGAVLSVSRQMAYKLAANTIGAFPQKDVSHAGCERGRMRGRSRK
jgi:hypothetical protein